MRIPGIRPDFSFLQSISSMNLSRDLTVVEKSFIHSILCDVKDKTTETKISLPPADTDKFTLDPKLVHEIISRVKEETSSTEEDALLEFVKAIDSKEISLIQNPLLKNYLLILCAAFHPLDSIIEDENERVALAYSALHGTHLTYKVLKEHLAAFKISRESILNDLKVKLDLPFSE